MTDQYDKMCMGCKHFDVPPSCKLHGGEVEPTFSCKDHEPEVDHDPLDDFTCPSCHQGHVSCRCGENNDPKDGWEPFITEPGTKIRFLEEPSSPFFEVEKLGVKHDDPSCPVCNHIKDLADEIDREIIAELEKSLEGISVNRGSVIAAQAITAEAMRRFVVEGGLSIDMSKLYPYQREMLFGLDEAKGPDRSAILRYGGRRRQPIGMGLFTSHNAIIQGMSAEQPLFIENEMDMTRYMQEFDSLKAMMPEEDDPSVKRKKAKQDMKDFLRSKGGKKPRW